MLKSRINKKMAAALLAFTAMSNSVMAQGFDAEAKVTEAGEKMGTLYGIVFGVILSLLVAGLALGWFKSKGKV